MKARINSGFSARSCKRFLFAAALLAFVAVGGCASTQRSSEAQGPAEDGASREAAAPEQDWITLFDGSSLEGWTMAGPGRFTLEGDSTMQTEGGMGLLYYDERRFRDFELKLDWKAATDSANSGIFLRFPGQTDDPWYAVNNGYEVQIGSGADTPINQTGAIYNFSAPYSAAAKPAGEWNTYRIKVTGQRYEVFLNGEKVNEFFGRRGREGYIGLQNHDPHSTVSFRNIRVRPLSGEDYPESLAEALAVSDRSERDPIRVLMVTATHGFRHGPAIDTSKQVLASLEETTEFQFDMTEDLDDLNAENLARYDVLFLNNATLRAKTDTAAMPTARSSDAVWRAYRLELDTPDSTMDGRAVFYGQPGDLSGQIEFEGQPAPGPLQEISFDEAQSKLTFYFTSDQYGRIDVATTLEGDTWNGTLTLTDQGRQSLFLKGTQISNPGLAENTTEAAADSISAEQREAIANFVREGNGFVGAHAALDAFYNWDTYREMVGGGLFEEHPWTQPVRIDVEKPGNPAMRHFGQQFGMRDEIYVLDENPRWNSRVLASLNMNSVGVVQGHADQTRDDYPIAWMRNYADGRVFMTKLGHFPDVWTSPAYLRHLLQGMRMAAGRIEADFSGHRVKDVIAKDVWPDDLAVDERGNVWIVELRGEVHRYDAAADTTQQVAQINTTNPTKIEHGLYGVEVDPNFYEGEPYLYLYYAEPETFINTLARFRYEDGALDLSSREVLLRVPTEPQCCHQAGDLEWGPDSTLYLSTGDTGMSETRPSWELTNEELQAFVENRELTGYHWSRLADSERSAQNLQDLRGKILRINKDGSIPKDNPFYGEPGVRWEVYAYGLRNPYRFKVHPETGKLYVGVVGPDAAYDYDEYNVAAKGGENFGWPRSIGRLFYNDLGPDDIPNYVPPLWEYTYESGGRSATVGPFFASEGKYAFPEVFHDKMIVFDWARRWLKWGTTDTLPFRNDTSASVKQQPLDIEIPTERYVNLKTFDQTTPTTPISMEVGPEGALYLAEFDGFWEAGPNAQVTRYRWISGNEAPVSSASARPAAEGDGHTFAFDASASYDPEAAGTLTYHWAFGDGTTSTAPRPQHTYREAGRYTARLTVTDAEGAESTPAEVTVVAGEEARVASSSTSRKGGGK